MKQKASKIIAPVSEDVLKQLVLELQRLAESIGSAIEEKSTLKSLSNLTAITPIQQMLMNYLSEKLFNSEESERGLKAQEMPGYL